MTTRVARLLVFPVKSLDGQEVESAPLLANGALAHDRAYALFDAQGEVVNAKRHPALQRLRSSLDVERGLLTLNGVTFDLAADRAALERHLSAALGFAVTCAENRDGGFPDDPLAPGPTLIGTATLEAIAGWFGLVVADVRARLHTNVEISGVPPFWEDRLFGPRDEVAAFTIGAARFLGINPCLRCAVPTRDPWSGAADRTFAKRFGALREEHLPAWAPRDRFEPFYRVAVNTRRAGQVGGYTVRVGDEVRLAEAL